MAGRGTVGGLMRSEELVADCLHEMGYLPHLTAARWRAALTSGAARG